MNDGNIRNPKSEIRKKATKAERRESRSDDTNVAVDFQSTERSRTENSVAERRLNELSSDHAHSKQTSQASLRDAARSCLIPWVETHGYIQSSLRDSSGFRGRGRLRARLATALVVIGFSVISFGKPASQTPAAPVKSDLTTLQCGNLIYAGNQSSVCFSDRFLTDVADQTNLRVNRKFCPVRLDADALFDYPFCVMSGNENFSLTDKERNQLRKFLTQGGFLLVSPGCSDEKWDKSFRQEIKLCFPEHSLKKIPMTHPIFSIVNTIPRLTDKNGKQVAIEGLEMNGRLVMIYSKEGLNDVEHAEGCCCCGGNEISSPERVNVNVFTYAVLY